MNPIKIKQLKRAWIDEENVSEIPLKKRYKEKKEKENSEINTERKSLTPPTSRKESKVLKESPLPKKEANAKDFNKYKSLHYSDDDADDDLEEMFLKLKKSGVKTVSSVKKSPGNVSSKKKKTGASPLVIQNKFKKRLVDEFEGLSDFQKKKRISNYEIKIPALEKVPEDVTLNCKKIPVVKIKLLELEVTPKKEESSSVETPLRRSTRRQSMTSKEEIIDLEKSPGWESNLSQHPLSKKSSSVKKKEGQGSKTPKSKYEEGLPSTPGHEKRTPSKRSSSVKKKEGQGFRTPKCKIEERLPSTPLEKARQSLHVSTVPESLPCRHKEYNDILTFLENKLWDGIGGCMYISGVPGTGKTATVTQVIRHLQDLSKKGKVPEFKYVEMNGMRLADPRQAYVQLWQKLFDKKEKITSDRAQRFLDNWFSKSDRRSVKITTVLLVDELDLICTKKQDVVYNLLDWPTRTHSRLVLLTIANTMDMPERLFKGRVTSRMGLTRLTFTPYTHKQLEEIVLARLNGLDAFVGDAVRLVTRKVAAVSGDARRALDICRRAAELPPPDEPVKISHIEQAIREMTNSNIVKVIRSCGEMEKLFLRSLSDVSLRSNADETDMREVIDQLFAICVLEGVSRPSVSSVLSVSNRLRCCRLILGTRSNVGILQKLTLNVTHDDLHYAFRT